MADSPIKFPQTRPTTRATRIYLRGSVSAVIQLENRRQFAARLHTLSITGGLLETSALIDERCKVALAFYISDGPLLTKAEMLFARPGGIGYLQPFRFTGYGAGVRQTLEIEIAAFQRDSILPQRPPAPAPAPVVVAPPTVKVNPTVPVRSGRGTGLELPRFFVETV